MLNHIIKLLPHQCQLCLSTIAGKQAFCHYCHKALQACYTETDPNENHFSAFHYQTPIREFITGFKFQHQLQYGRNLSLLMAERIKTCQIALPQLLIPVPLHHTRCQYRGYNQALLIAKVLSKQLNIKIAKQFVKRIKRTKAQSLLKNHRDRKKNVANCFRITYQGKQKLNHVQHVTIIDDVTTTGATLQALQTCLLQSNPNLQISYWTLATAH